MIHPKSSVKVIAKIIGENGNFPNNPKLPFLIYKGALNLKNKIISDVTELVENNGWKNLWVDSIFTYHHYHSNTHEMLVVFSGNAKVQIGGRQGKIFSVHAGDVIFHPAGVSHKKIKSSEDFKTVGAYPTSEDYDMKYGKKDEYEESVKNIRKVKLPKTDPIYGRAGKLFEYWAEKTSIYSTA